MKKEKIGNMLFYVLVAVVVIVFITFLVKTGEFFNAFFFSFITSMLSMILIIFLYLIIPSNTSDHSYEKQTLRTVGGDSVDGEYYLTGKIIDDERYITYMPVEITDEKENLVTIKDIPAEQSKIIISDVKEPYLKITHSEKHIPWITPWGFGLGSNYTFYVPEGSVLSDPEFIKLSEEAESW